MINLAISGSGSSKTLTDGAVPDKSEKAQESQKRPRSGNSDDALLPGKQAKAEFSTSNEKSALIGDSLLLTEDVNVGYVNRLPVVAVENIASKLALPDLLSFRQTCKHVNWCIGERIISKAKEKIYYIFDRLSPISKEKHDEECETLTKFLNGTLHSQAGNVPVFHNREMSIKSESLEVVKIDAIDNKDVFVVGSLSDGKKFILVNAFFREIKNLESGRMSLNMWTDSSIYVGNSYNEIIQLIKDKRDDALPKHVDFLLKHKIYYW